MQGKLAGLVPEKKSSKEEKSKVQEIFDRDFNDYRVCCFRYSFIKDGRINARGRVFFKVILMLLSLMYLATDVNLIEIVSYISIVTLLFPFMINLVTKLIISKQNIRANNLYDMLYAFGLYIFSLLPVTALIIYVLKKVGESYPHLYESFTGFPFIVTLLAAIALLADFAMFLVEKYR